MSPRKLTRPELIKRWRARAKEMRALAIKFEQRNVSQQSRVAFLSAASAVEACVLELEKELKK